MWQADASGTEGLGKEEKGRDQSGQVPGKKQRCGRVFRELEVYVFL